MIDSEWVGLYNSKYASQTVYFDFRDCILNTFLAFLFAVAAARFLDV